jgi:2-polyprenyl-6-methoxyphenol hydroxylase-like FAD-dependent oxidoreductase
MAGLLAARVLSDHFQRVTLVERDPLQAEAHQRPGVPQGRHTHGVLASGSEVIEALFPGMTRSLVEAGALLPDIGRDLRWFFEGGCLNRADSGLNGWMVSRPVLEAAVRRRVRAIANVAARGNTIVEGLELAGGRVRGIRIAGETLTGDLTVDATGRGSRTPEWLESAGFEKPKRETVEVGLGYTTRFFRRNPSDLQGDLGAIIPSTVEGKRGGVMIAQEGDRWTVTLIGQGGDFAPTELSGFIDFAATLPAPYIHEVVCGAEPLGEAASFRFPASVRNRYESLARFPEGFLVVGDAICSFNPIYGQGMSVAALGAKALHEALSHGSTDLSKAFLRHAGKLVDIPWSMAVGNDLRMPETVGPRTPGVRVVNWYMSKLHRAAHADAAVALAFHRVGNLLAPPPAVMHPRIALRVLWGNLVPAKRSSLPEARRSASAAR